MRQLLLYVPRDDGARVLRTAREHGGVNLARVAGCDADGRPLDVVSLSLPNDAVGRFLDALEPHPSLHVSYVPTGSLTLRPPDDEVARHVRDVALRSPLEVYLAGLRAIGSWGGLLGYAATAGVVAWMGLYTDTLFLLVGAMLIAPFAGPAMNAALATARGDRHLLAHSLVRYVAALVVAALVAALLSLLVRQRAATEAMVRIADISAMALLLPLAAGAAGALYLVQDDGASLVSGAGAGMLVAASLAPPAALVGMAVAIADWSLLPPAAFLLTLQLLGIELAGAAAFRLAGVRPGEPRYPRGRTAVTVISLAAGALGVAGLLAWQFASASPTLLRASEAQRVRQALTTGLRRDGGVTLVDASARFTRAHVPGAHPLLVSLAVRPAAAVPEDSLRASLVARVRAVVARESPGATPFVDVRVLR